MPEHYKNKSKANVASANDRPDDFVDRNDAHISAMARMVASEEELMSDEEFWGLEATNETPKFDGIVVWEEHTDLSQQKSEEIVETGVLDQLFYRAKFGGDESQDPVQSSESPPPSPTPSPTMLAQDGGVIVDDLPHETSLHFLAYTASDSQPVATNEWTIDSGCTNHMYFDKEDFSDYQPLHAGITIADRNIV